MLTASAPTVLSRRANVKDFPMAAAAVNGDASSVSGGRVFTFKGMMCAAAYMARVKDGEALEDVVPALCFLLNYPSFPGAFFSFAATSLSIVN